jgi:ubiquinone/menaquinone biosynthesis C-methylase UbiE
MLQRVLEPEVMDSPQEAADYDAMDHREVNARFVEDLLAVVTGSSLPSDVCPSRLPAAGADGDLERPWDVLDVGTGTAQIPIVLCQRWEPCRVLAVDAAVSMLDLARYNLEIANLTHRVQLAHADAKQLPFRDGMFDVVMSNSILHHIPQPLAVLREAVRVVRPGGWLFFRDLVRPSSRQELQRLVETYASDANARQRQMFANSLHAALTLEEIQALVQQLGFKPDTVRQTSDRHWTWAIRR